MNPGPVLVAMPAITQQDPAQISRTYAKGVVEGFSHIPLTSQEQQALAAAPNGEVLT